MSTKADLLNARIQHPPERLTLFSICCPCLRPKKLRCRASDIALVMYGKDEPHDYVVEKLVIKRIPLRLFGVENDFIEYENSLKESSKMSAEREIAFTNLETKGSTKIEEAKKAEPSKQQEQKKNVRRSLEQTSSSSSLIVNYNANICQSTSSEPSLIHRPTTIQNSSDELVLRTITAHTQHEMVTEVDQRIAKMSPDLEHTINSLKAVKPRPVSIQGIPMPIKNQKKRLSTRNIEYEGILTKGSYNYTPCVNDNPLQGIHYTLNKTTFTPAVEEDSKSIITETIVEEPPKLMVEEATTNYEDATVLVEPEEPVTICTSAVNIPSIRSQSGQRKRRDNLSSDSNHCLDSVGSRRLANLIHSSHGKKQDFGNTNFSVYHAEMLPGVGKRCSLPKKKKYKWKIVINKQSKDLVVASTSSLDC